MKSKRKWGVLAWEVNNDTKIIRMKATELRVNNLVLTGGNEQYVVSIDIDDPQDPRINDCQEIAYQPIPLTEEWLVKFGFEPNEMERFGIGDGSKEIRIGGENSVLIICVKSKWCAVMDDDFESCNIKFPDNVHQLQNLYHALTGEELTTK